MTEPLIPGGYILLSRKLIESEIWDKPPLYIKIWIYLLSKAQHRPYKGLDKGQLWVSIPEIREKCSWQIGYRKVKPTKDQVFQVIEWLRNPTGKNSRSGCAHVCEHDTKATMITTTKATQGMLVNIDNYCFYQDPKNYESNDEGNDEKATKATSEQQQPDNINKNDKNVKNEKELVNDPFSRELLNILKNIKNYPLDIGADTGFIQQLLIDYPALDIKEELKKWAIYKLDKPLTGKSNPRSQFRNWCKKAAEWQKERTPKQPWDSNNRAYQPWEPPED
jgi:hypothetical protein